MLICFNHTKLQQMAEPVNRENSRMHVKSVSMFKISFSHWPVYHFGESEGVLALRKEDGEVPTCFLKKLLKYAASSDPKA